MANEEDLPTRPGGISDAWFYRIKAATRDLVAHCGGIQRAADKSSSSKSQVGRWQSVTDGDVIPLPQVLALEADCGVPFVTTVMAELQGRRLTDAESGDVVTASGLHSAHAEAMRAAAETMAAMAAALADGRITKAEAEIINRNYGTLEGAVTKTRQALAAIGGNVEMFPMGGRGHD
ncbi:MAG: hypothetical protein C0457_06535 [Polymorphum sp.]|nr:hypothetical protein [Polymorphum sp.]